MANTESIVLAFFTEGERVQAIFLPYGVHLLSASGEDFMWIGLVAHIPHQAICRRIVDVVQGNCQFDYTQTGRILALDQDRMMGNVHFLMVQTSFRRAVAEQVQAASEISVTKEDILEMITVEREHRIWRVYFREESPERIDQIAPDLWFELESMDLFYPWSSVVDIFHRLVCKLCPRR